LGSNNAHSNPGVRNRTISIHIRTALKDLTGTRIQKASCLLVIRIDYFLPNRYSYSFQGIGYMKCPECRAENAEGARFCSSCAAPLTAAQSVEPVFTKTLETPMEKLARGTLFAGRYEIIEELGRGGMGTVYRAEDKKANEEIAIKVIKPEIAAQKKTIERFRNELTTARKIRHKNICGMYDIGEYQGTYYIAMEYVPGEDLRSFIRRSKRLSNPNAIAIAKQITEGLSEAHRQGVVHRDLKPSNVMIDKDGNGRIMDFGIARTLKTQRITGDGVVIGTPEYMPPEQAEARDIDRRSDIYSLGVILYEMVTGRLPFVGDTALSIAMKHKSEIPEDPKTHNPQIPDDLSLLILKCLEKDREKRYQNAEEVLAELEDIEKGIPTTAQKTHERKALTSKEITVTIAPKKLLMPLLAVAALIVIAIVIWQLLPEKDVLPVESVQPSIAVLPFEDLSPERDQEFLCDGFSESLINALTKIEGLRVPARTSSFSFKGKDQSVQEIGEKLGVKTVLEGSVQRAGDELRVTVKLINVSDESVQWSEQYSRKLDDVFTIQDEITLKVVEELRVKLATGERAELTKRSTTNAEAYQLYLLGRHFRWIEIKENFLKAKDYFLQAIAIDPNYSTAYAGLADTYMLLGLFAMMPRNEAAYQAKNAAQRALELDENLAEAHTSMGVVLEIFDWDWGGAEQEFQRAISLNPNHFDAHYEYGAMLIRLKRLDEAEAELQNAARIDPLSYRVHAMLATVYQLRGETEKAEEHRKKRNELDPVPPSTGSEIERIQKWIERDGRLPQYLRVLAYAYIQSGQEDEALKLIDELKQMYAEKDIGNTALVIIGVYLFLDEKDQALTWLEKAYERRDPLLIMLNVYEFLEPLRQDPRFKAIQKKMGLD
jgi:serine/threonine protein kinase/tetratricopeptide (TPR) repeat protein